MSFVQNGEILIRIGARGELYGRCEEWDELCFGNVRQILIMHGNAVNSVQVSYDLNGMMVLSHRRGGDGDKFDCINMEPWEYITEISGHYGPVDDSGMTTVRSLTFRTNRPVTYGPYGREEGTEFSFRLQPGAAFGGFHGRCGSGYLRALGIYVKTEAGHHFKPDPARRRTLPALSSAPDDSARISSTPPPVENMRQRTCHCVPQ